MHSITNVIAGLAMGITILVGQKIGEGLKRDAGKAIGSAISLFALISLGLTAILIPTAPFLAKLLNAPVEAFDQTVNYVRICCSGLIFIVAYNILGSIFRGIGDSQTPLITVSISCVLNIFGDLLFVAVFNMGAAGAALATIISQAVSVLTSYLFIRKKQLPIEFGKTDIKLERLFVEKELKLGTPIAMQELLVGLSFLVIQAVVNSISLAASAGIGIGEKVCGFIMLVPSAFAQSMTAFVAQNYGAGKNDRATKALKYGIITSLCFGIIMCFVSFFHGDFLASLFNSDPDVIVCAHDHMKAYGIDCLFTPIMFCMVGFFNGYGKTTFVMLQGVLSAFCIRTPLALILGHFSKNLFIICLSTPCTTFLQIFACFAMYFHTKKSGLFNNPH